MPDYGWISAIPEESHDYIVPKIISLIQKKQKLRILDAGCGNGFLAGKLAELGHEVYGIDQDVNGIKIAQVAYPNVKFFPYSVFDTPDEFIEFFDYVIATEVIEHLFSPSKFLANMHKLVRPEGFIILSTPFHGYFKNLAISIFGKWDKHFTVGWEGGHIKFFSAQTLEQLLVLAGFSNCEFNNAGRIKFLWKSIVCKAQKKMKSGLTCQK